MFIACFGGCAYLALQPDERVETCIDVALLPARALGELASPMRWSRARAVSAAQSALSEREAADFDARRSLAEAERRAVLPRRPDLLARGRFVHAEVVGRREKHADQLVIEPDRSSCEGLAIGMPVAVGDVFVGRIADFDPQDPGRAFVNLVTAKDFAVGTELDPDVPADDGAEPARVSCVAGGVLRKGALYIALHSPSSPVSAGMFARVDESLSTLDGFGAQAQGFDLGRVVALASDQCALQPLVDYQAGLFQVVVVAPHDIARTEDIASDDVLLDNLLFDGAWLATRAFTCGEPAHGREGLKISAGRWSGARDGAALVTGVRLVGLVVHAGPLWSDVRTLGDAGSRIPVLARIEGRDAPVALGTFVARGREREGDTSVLVFEWTAVVPLSDVDAGATVHATLFTGSGDPNLPRGLVLGEADLPGGVGAHRAVVRQDIDVRELSALWLFRGQRSGVKP